MISKDVLEKQLQYTLKKTNFNLGKKYEGKVRDSYILGDKRIIVTTDRISAFDRVLCTLPFKGEVLNRVAGFWFDKTKHIIPNHVISLPDPQVLLGKECELIPVEMVVRGYLTGTTTTSAWYNYERGVRDFCGNALPEGMKKDQAFETPIITPSTKAEKGAHDESLSGAELVKRGIISQDVYDQMAEVALKLFNFGSEYVAKNNLILVDTKYEFGLLDGKLVLIDEIHTPDSSRFWIKDTYEERFSAGKSPKKLDKEYVRAWLAERGFIGEGTIPEIPAEVKVEAAQRYITAFEMITGETFTSKVGDVTARIKKNLKVAGLL